jgi:hypothetical protein|uniref:Uncharacterized protein n=1 Tax=viral metagenome TaxID=1070528 RepID=A0A6C0M494_9ZZZZ
MVIIYLKYTMESSQNGADHALAEEVSMLECAMRMTRVCEKKRSSLFKNITTGDPNAKYIYCCAYTAPAITVSIMFLQYYNITSIKQLDDMLNDRKLLGQDCIELNHDLVCNGINEVTGHIWSHHYDYGTGIDQWINDPTLFDDNPEMGVNLVSFFDVELNATVHHSMIYVSLVNPEICYIIDSWSSNCNITRDLTMRQLKTADVMSAISEIMFSPDPSRIMTDVFLDPVPGGSCKSPLQVIKLNRDVIYNTIITHFGPGCRGESRFVGGKIKRTHKRRPVRNHKSTYKRKRITMPRKARCNARRSNKARR